LQQLLLISRMLTQLYLLEVLLVITTLLVCVCLLDGFIIHLTTPTGSSARHF
jgi:hypothetical protein